MKDEMFYLIHVMESIEAIELYTGEGEDAFMKSRRDQDAVIRNFEVMGEAIKRIPPQLKQKFPDVPWGRIAGFRDVLIHDYMHVDLDEVWNIVEQGVPELKTAIEKIMDSLGGRPKPPGGHN